MTYTPPQLPPGTCVIRSGTMDVYTVSDRKDENGNPIAVRENEKPKQTMSTTEPPKYPRVWVFDINNRVYPTAPEGRLLAASGPIYREHWVEEKIVGENRASWILSGRRRKIPKKGGWGIAFSQQEVDDDVFIHDHRYKIGEHIRTINDVSLLRKIAELVGYRGEEGKD